MLFAGMTSLMATTRHHPPSATRTAIAQSVAVSMIGLAVLGTVEWLQGNVGPGVGLAVSVELVLATMLLQAR